MSELSLCVLAEAGLSAEWLRADVGAWLLLLVGCALPLLALGQLSLRWLIRAVVRDELIELRRRLDECYAAVIDLRVQAYELGGAEPDEVSLAEHNAFSPASEREPPQACA